MVLTLPFLLTAASPSPALKSKVRTISEQVGVDSLLVYAVIATESSWNPSAINSGSGCIGLMQINPPFHGGHSVAYYLDAENNLRLGVEYLRWLLDKFEEDWEKALTGYCYGPYSKAIDRGESPYSIKVLKRFNKQDDKRSLWLGVYEQAWVARHITKTDNKKVFSFNSIK